MTQSPKTRVAEQPGATESPVAQHETEHRHLGRPVRVHLPPPKKGPDKAFLAATWGSGILLVMLVVAIAAFLLATAAPSLAKDTVNFWTSTQWQVADSQLAFGILGMLWTTVISSVIAMVLAVPIAIGVALLVSHYVRPAIGRAISFLVDLLAAVPSVVYGLWGAALLGPAVDPFGRWVQRHLGWIALFGPGLSSSGTVFVASLVLAIMILPIITSISRDVFEQTPRDHIEAAWALGATKWEMITTAVLPYGRSGVVAASMLGLGRALGETIAVMLILSTTNSTAVNFSIFAGGETFASKIANSAAEFDSQLKTGAYIAAGLVLFLLTFVVNGLARVVAAGGKAKP